MSKKMKIKNLLITQIVKQKLKIQIQKILRPEPIQKGHLNTQQMAVVSSQNF